MRDIEIEVGRIRVTGGAGIEWLLAARALDVDRPERHAERFYDALALQQPVTGHWKMSTKIIVGRRYLQHVLLLDLSQVPANLQRSPRDASRVEAR